MDVRGGGGTDGGGGVLYTTVSLVCCSQDMGSVNTPLFWMQLLERSLKRLYQHNLILI